MLWSGILCESGRVLVNLQRRVMKSAVGVLGVQAKIVSGAQNLQILLESLEIFASLADMFCVHTMLR